MIVYNVTIKVSHTVAADWINWLKEEHIADVINTNCFTHATVLRLLDIDEEDGITYAVQYHARNKKLYEEYLEKHADTMRKKGMDKWGDQFIAFRSVMEVVY
ncbi:MAG: DUF4286 family protein [Chitinophagaceae bacterium]